MALNKWQVDKIDLADGRGLFPEKSAPIRLIRAIRVPAFNSTNI
jgi:hypothetical protein